MNKLQKQDFIFPSSRKIHTGTKNERYSYKNEFIHPPKLQHFKDCN